jgi:hypothetical protein
MFQYLPNSTVWTDQSLTWQCDWALSCSITVLDSRTSYDAVQSTNGVPGTYNNTQHLHHSSGKGLQMSRECPCNHRQQLTCEISGSHGNEYENDSLLGYWHGAIAQKAVVFNNQHELHNPWWHHSHDCLFNSRSQEQAHISVITIWRRKPSSLCV